MFRKPCRNRGETSLVEKDGGKRFPKGDSFSGWRERKGAPLFIVGNIARQHATETERVFIAMTVTSFLPGPDLALHSTHAKQSQQLTLARGDAISEEEKEKKIVYFRHYGK